MKVTYLEWKEFWKALEDVPGHKNNWYEDEVPSFTDKATDADTIDVRWGSLIWQGDGEEKPHPLIKNGGDWLATFKAWKKSLDYKTFVVVVHKDVEGEFRDLAAQHKWKVSGG
jgi:hypothetical protein